MPAKSTRQMSELSARLFNIADHSWLWSTATIMPTTIKNKNMRPRYTPGGIKVRCSEGWPAVFARAMPWISALLCDRDKPKNVESKTGPFMPGAAFSGHFAAAGPIPRLGRNGRLGECREEGLVNVLIGSHEVVAIQQDLPAP